MKSFGHWLIMSLERIENFKFPKQGNLKKMISEIYGKKIELVYNVICNIF